MATMTLQEFREEYQALLHRVEATNMSLWDALTSWIDRTHRRLPLFEAGHLTRDLQYVAQSARPSWITEKNKSGALQLGDQYFLVPCHIEPEFDLWIDATTAVGDTWVFQNKWPDGWTACEGKPEAGTLTSLLLETPAQIPAIFVYRVNKNYLFTDGNHRLYASYLLGRPIKVTCDFAYTEFYDSMGNRID